MYVFKISLLAIILSFILTFMCDYFAQDFISAMDLSKRKEDKDIIRNVFRIAMFCLILISFLFFGMITANMVLNNL